MHTMMQEAFMNPNDRIRQQILQYFYDRNKNATSQYGKKGSAVKISDVKRELKKNFGLTQQQAVSNLTYLIDKGWINKTEIEKTVRVRGGTVPSTVTWYEISADGIDKIEGESEFQTNPRFAGVNIQATGANIITLGDGNIVNAQFADLHKELENLKRAIATSEEINDKQKLDLMVDIESIRDQLAKSQPNKTIITHLWSGIEKVVTAAGLVDTLVKVKPFITLLLI